LAEALARYWVSTRDIEELPRITAEVVKAITADLPATLGTHPVSVKQLKVPPGGAFSGRHGPDPVRVVPRPVTASP
jgi:hypothetical protein